MATLDYVSIPSCATRLQAQSQSPTKSNRPKPSNVSDIRPVTKLRTSLPRSPPDFESLSSPTSSKGFAAGSAFNLLPQMLLSSSLPSGAGSNVPNVSGSNALNPGKNRAKKARHEPVLLLSNKDPLSIQITTVNFKRFIERVGPVFWLQDRIEEIVFWRRGWKLTGTWLAAYAFICYFPRLVFVLPHIMAIATILATVNYPQYKPPAPATTFTPPAASSVEAPAAEAPLPPPVEDSVDWQANIQAIQNLMGFYADVHASVTPYLTHLSLSPNTAELSKPGSKSPYTLPILTLLILTLPPSIFFVTSPLFPARLVSFVCGAAPIIVLNPTLHAWASTLHRHISLMQEYTIPLQPLNEIPYSLPLPLPASVTIPPAIRSIASRLGISLSPKLNMYEIPSKLILMRKRLRWGIQRFIDNNNLSDEVWNSEMREIELWENERLDPVVSPAPVSTSSISHRISHTRSGSGASTSSIMGIGTRVASPPPHVSPPPYSEKVEHGDDDGIGVGVGAAENAHTDEENFHRTTPAHQRRKSTMFGSGSGGWSKSHLRPGERAAWTRGRDGWSGVAGASASAEGGGTVRFANLTFALAPGWVFVDTEDWRPDLEASWVRECDVAEGEGEDEDVDVSELGGDENGWVYTNDSWLEPSAYAYPGAVTRRRKWVRRIWYNQSSVNGGVS